MVQRCWYRITLSGSSADRFKIASYHVRGYMKRLLVRKAFENVQKCKDTLHTLDGIRI
jgi:hypothetical protein